MVTKHEQGKSLKPQIFLAADGSAKMVMMFDLGRSWRSIASRQWSDFSWDIRTTLGSEICEVVYACWKHEFGEEKFGMLDVRGTREPCGDEDGKGTRRGLWCLVLLVAECQLRWREGRQWGFRDGWKGQEEVWVATEMLTVRDMAKVLFLLSRSHKLGSFQHWCIQGEAGSIAS